ncbi:MAG TPA: DUF4349 domain-containing protein [Candidatus Obscuribacterales bacterium]
MVSSIQRQGRSLLGLILASGTLMVSCAAAPSNESQMAESAAPVSGDMVAPSSPEAIAPGAENQAGAPSLAAATTVPRSQPQLIKQAELTIQVESIDDSLAAVNAIARQYQGDLLSLNTTRPRDEQQPRSASLELRVPQAQLDGAIASLSELGDIQQQSLSAQDVSAQLVDYDARLRNLRKSEELVLDIMERSGDMNDVLTVARELDTIRASIEQIDAQLSALRNQVSYSTIRLTLQTEGAIASGDPSAGTQISRTWQQAKVAVGKLTVDLVQLIIWLLVFSPYWLSGVGMVFAVKYLLSKSLRHDRPAPVAVPPAQE